MGEGDLFNRMFDSAWAIKWGALRSSPRRSHDVMVRNIDVFKLRRELRLEAKKLDFRGVNRCGFTLRELRDRWVWLEERRRYKAEHVEQGLEPEPRRIGFRVNNSRVPMLFFNIVRDLRQLHWFWAWSDALHAARHKNGKRIAKNLARRKRGKPRWDG